MPMIPMPEAPTAPTLGRASNAILKGGYISGDLAPFVSMGGGIEGQDPYQLNIAGQWGSRLGKHMYLKGPDEQRQIMAGIRTERLNAYVNDLMGQGYSKINQNRLEKTEGGFKTYVNIDWATGNIDTNSEALPQAHSSGGSKGGTIVIPDYSGVIQSMSKQLESQNDWITNFSNTAINESGQPVLIAGGQSAYDQAAFTKANTAQTPSGGMSIMGGQSSYNKITSKTTPTSIISAITTTTPKTTTTATKSSSGGGGGSSSSKSSAPIVTAFGTSFSTPTTTKSSGSSSSSSGFSSAANVSAKVSASLPAAFSGAAVYSAPKISAPAVSSFVTPKVTPSLSSSYTSTPAKSSSSSSSGFSGISNAIGKAISNIFGKK